MVQPVLHLEGRLRRELWSIGVEGRFVWPVTGALSSGALTTSAVLGSLVPCLHSGWFAGCAEVSFGALRLEGSGLSDANSATVFHASAGLRAVFQVPLGEHFAVGALAEGDVPFTRASAVVGGVRAWTVAPVGGALSACVSLLL